MRAADAAVAARDPSLPLGLVLDDDALLAAVAAAWPGPGAPPTALRVGYLRYKPATLAEGEVVLELDGRARTMWLLATAPDAAPKLVKALGRRDLRPDGTPTVALPGGSLALLPLGADRRVRAVRHLGRPSFLGGATEGMTVETIAYRPGRRVVLRVAREGEPRALVRLYAEEAWPAASVAHAWAASTASAGLLPSTLARDDARRALLLPWAPGIPAPAVAQELDGRVAAAIGRRLASLHRADPAGLPPRRTQDPADLARAVLVLAPRLEPAVREAESHARAASGDPAAGHAIHGDLGPEQVIVDGGTIHLVDADRAAVGDPGLDLAAWAAARLASGALGAGLDSLDCLGIARAAIGDALLAGYGEAAGPATLEAALRHLPAALLARAVSPFRRRDPAWEARTEDLVLLAARLGRPR